MPVGRMLTDMNAYELECWREFFSWRKAQEDGAPPELEDDEEQAKANQSSVAALMAFAVPQKTG